MTCKLSVNVNAVAFLRNRRHVPWPDLLHVARIALEAGASGITIHPRPDERHIRRSDVGPLRALIANDFPHAEFNIEGYPDEDFLQLVKHHLPHQVTLVPDLPGQSTSDHGWNFASQHNLLEQVIGRIKQSKMRVSVFIDPDATAPAQAKSVGADRVEIYTGPYGGAGANTLATEFSKVIATGQAAKAVNLGLNAGHDLTRANLPALVSALPNLAEVSIGHAIFADAWEFGLAETVRLFRQAIGDLK